jgi:hypothetical protein
MHIAVVIDLLLLFYAQNTESIASVPGALAFDPNSQKPSRVGWAFGILIAVSITA